MIKKNFKTLFILLIVLVLLQGCNITGNPIFKLKPIKSMDIERNLDNNQGNSLNKNQILKRIFRVVYPFKPLFKLPQFHHNNFHLYNEIDVENNFGNDLVVTYDKFFVNNNGLRTYFKYKDGNILAYNTIVKNNTELLVKAIEYDHPNIIFQTMNVLTNGEQFYVKDYNETHVNLEVQHICNSGTPPSCIYLNQPLSNYYYLETSNFKFYVDKDLLPNEEVKQLYFEKLNLNNESLNFLEENLGVEPVPDKIVMVSNYDPDRSGGWSTGFYVVSNFNRVLTLNDLSYWQHGSTHELVHVLFFGTQLKRSWFEEGLADYMEQLEKGTVDDWVCTEEGWSEFNSNEIIPYSNFSEQPSNSASFYDPRNRHSYYISAECFWRYIVENYGAEKLKEIAQGWQNTRKTLPPEDKYLIRDIVNPVLGTNITQLVYDRYSYLEI